MEYGYGYIHLCAEQRWKKTSVIKKSINAVKDENGHEVTNWMAKDDLLQWKYTVVLFILLILIIFYSFFLPFFLRIAKFTETYINAWWVIVPMRVRDMESELFSGRKGNEGWMTGGGYILY